MTVMDRGPIEPARAVDSALAAWAATLESVVPVDADAVGATAALAPAPTNPAGLPGAGLVERVLGEANPAGPVSEPALPGMDTDPGHESATVQTLSRPLPLAYDAAREAAGAPPSAPQAKSEFALPASLLVPAMLVGLQVEPATGWPLPRRAEPERPRGARGDGCERVDPAAERRDRHQDEPQEPQPAREEPDTRSAVQEPPLEQCDSGEWSEALTQALRAALAARMVPQALLAAAEQWQRGRCVVLACPQGSDPAGPAWAFVLWPRRQANPSLRPAADGNAAPDTLSLFGLRVSARLQWHTLPPTTPWCHARVIKEHHPHRGRQLVAPDNDIDSAAAAAAAAASAAPPCAVQLGPVLARSLRWCEVRVHIQAAQRFWAALGRQWSVHVVVSARPLVSARAPMKESSPC
jgi:hypothetical protein